MAASGVWPGRYRVVGDRARIVTGNLRVRGGTDWWVSLRCTHPTTFVVWLAASGHLQKFFCSFLQKKDLITLRAPVLRRGG
jgi:hypothetical protein